MIQVPELTEELLRELGREVRGCSFTADGQKAFLGNIAACDVQAAPGNGKTTLLVAKFALLSRSWTSRTEGVCVISHTNAARFEVEKRLAGLPRAVAFLAYPHFVGTVTAFIGHFIALPYLRGLGWSVRRIDDDVFAALARARYQAKPNLRAIAQHQQNNVENWVSRLEPSKDFVCEPGPVPARLAVVGRPRQPRAQTASGTELEQLKAELTRAGYFRYGDMTAIAHQALMRCPVIIERLRARFPLAILDEAQDTQGEQLSLLRRVFGEGVAFQLLGDQNQTLYEDADVDQADCWQPAADAIPLNETRRFGPDIASFASRLTVRNPQAIVGVAGQEGHRCMLLFDRPSIGRVLPAFAEDVRRQFGGAPQGGHEAWAVASRHNLYRQRGGNWPKSLVDYHPAYRSSTSRSRRPHTLCSMLRVAALKHSGHGLPADVARDVAEGMAELLRIAGLRGPMNEVPNSRNIWRILASRSKKADVQCRTLVLNQAVKGIATWDEVTWAPFIASLAEIVGFAVPAAGADNELSRFLLFDNEGAGAAADSNARTSARFGDVLIQLGSIHSVKGRTVDSILIVETEVYKGTAAADRAMDLATVLPHAFGLEGRDFAANNAHLSAATNIFVGATRARSLLSLAVRKEAVSPELLPAAEGQGWIIHDLTRAT